MAYKRRRFSRGGLSGVSTNPNKPSMPHSSSHPATISRMSSIARSVAPTSPGLPQLPIHRRISFRPSNSQVSSVIQHSQKEEGVQEHETESEEDAERRENDDSMNEIIMAVDMRDHGSIGCAYYIAREEKLCLMEDIKMAGLEMIDTLKLHANPTVILISTRSDEKLEDHLSKDARGIDQADNASKGFVS